MAILNSSRPVTRAMARAARRLSWRCSPVRSPPRARVSRHSSPPSCPMPSPAPEPGFVPARTCTGRRDRRGHARAAAGGRTIRRRNPGWLRAAVRMRDGRLERSLQRLDVFVHAMRAAAPSFASRSARGDPIASSRNRSATCGVCMLAEGAGDRTRDERPSQWLGSARRVIIESRRGDAVQRLEIARGSGSERPRGTSAAVERPFDAAAQQWRDRMLALLDTTWEISSLRGQVSSLRGQISSIHGQESSLRGEISSLRGEVSSMRGRASSVRGEESSLRGRISSIHGHVSSLRGAISSERGAISSLYVGARRQRQGMAGSAGGEDQDTRGRDRAHRA